MNYMNRLLLFACCLIATSKVSAQIVGTDCFLQGQWIEVGINQMGGFGTCTSPASYHSHGTAYSLTPVFTASGNIDVSYDWGHDGWAVGGSLPFMGAYTQPGYPQEGWSVQVGATEYRNGGWGGLCSGAFDIPGSITGYSNIGGDKTGYWNGSIAGLDISQVTHIDTNASWVVVTTVLKNNTSSPIANVWYERTSDPDNASYWGGGSTTRNIILHQNEDARHMVQISTNAETGIYNAANSYMGYCTKDCRAKVGIVSGLSPSTTPAVLWSGGSGVVSTALHYTNLADEGVFLVFNIGTIPGNDSAIVSYAILFSGDNAIDSALPDPKIVINGIPHPSWAPPTPNYDTFNVCLYPGMTNLPVNILYGDVFDWSWSHWTWSPATGLSSTTGTSVNINTTALPPEITYTITGTDSATGMTSCNHKVFYLTVYTCNGATCNSPCVGDSLLFNAPGDSTNATYMWFGPAPSTTVFSTTQTGYKYPATMADTGTYTVIKSVLGVPVDTATIYAHIHPLPVVTPTSDQTSCAPIVATLHLAAGDDSGTVWSWTGPAGFTSTDKNPIVYAFDSTKQGTYNVHVVTQYGCASDASVNVWPGVVPEFDTTKYPGCPYDSVVFMNLSSNADSYEWDFGDGTTHDFTRNPSEHIYTGGHHSYNVTLKASNAHCNATITHSIDLSHSVTAAFTVTDTICNGSAATFTDGASAVLYGAAVTPLYSHIWHYGDGTSDSTNGSAASHTYPSEGIYNVTEVVTDSIGCADSTTHTVYVLQPYMHTMSDTTFCLLQPLALYNSEWISPADIADNYGFTYSWSPSSYLSSDTAHIPLFDSTGTHIYTLTATINSTTFPCQVQGVFTLHSILPRQLANVTPTTTIILGSSVYLNADSELNYTWIPNDGSLSNPDINNPVATPTVTTTYTVYGMDYYGCRDTATVTIIVDSTETEDIPTGFSPNGDGLNDVFRPLGQRFQRLVEMRIFNRWGECIYSSSDINKGWDGTYKGVPQDMGTYSYSIIVSRPGYGNNIVYKGTVTLIR